MNLQRISEGLDDIAADNNECVQQPFVGGVPDGSAGEGVKLHGYVLNHNNTTVVEHNGGKQKQRIAQAAT